MGGGSYSSVNRSIRAEDLGYSTKSRQEIFSSKLHDSMKSSKAKYRESRDSVEHPNSFPVIIGLDVTGSMGDIPHMMVKDGLPTIMQGIIDAGFPDPQVLFLGIGDHECDQAPLQVGQFESNDAALDMWLTRTWIESGGGGNGGESYHLAWMFAANHTEHDAFVKRGAKGLLITIGDEPCLSSIPRAAVLEIMGEGEVGYTAKDVLAKARETYNVFHINIVRGGWGRRDSESSWKDLLPENTITVEDYKTIPSVITKLVISATDRIKDIAHQPSHQPTSQASRPADEVDEDDLLDEYGIDSDNRRR